MRLIKGHLSQPVMYAWLTIHNHKTELHLLTYLLCGPFRKTNVKPPLKCWCHYGLASLCSGSLEPFPTCVLNNHHWIIDYSFATINWFLWTEHLMMLQPVKWSCPAAFIFFHKCLCIFPFAKRLSASHGPEQSFWHLPRLPDGMWACGIRLCVCLCPAPFMDALINKMVLKRGIQY